MYFAVQLWILFIYFFMFLRSATVCLVTRFGVVSWQLADVFSTMSV